MTSLHKSARCLRWDSSFAINIWLASLCRLASDHWSRDTGDLSHPQAPLPICGSTAQVHTTLVDPFHCPCLGAPQLCFPFLFHAMALCAPSLHVMRAGVAPANPAQTTLHGSRPRALSSRLPLQVFRPTWGHASQDVLEALELESPEPWSGADRAGYGTWADHNGPKQNSLAHLQILGFLPETLQRKPGAWMLIIAQGPKPSPMTWKGQTVHPRGYSKNKCLAKLIL